MDLSKRLQKLRRERGLSQENLAEKLGVSRQAVSKWESGQTTPDLEKLVALTELYQVSMDYLVKGKETSKEKAPEPEAPAPDQEDSTRETSFWEYRRRYRWQYEYRSKRTLFGLPLLHVNLGSGARRAKGVLAIGNFAAGIFSIGLCSAGIFSMGLLSAGVVTFGLLAAGVIALGSVAVGLLFAAGGIAMSLYLAVGGLAVAGNAAIGGMALAQNLAVGGYAHAQNLAIGDAGQAEEFFKLAADGRLMGDREAFLQAVEGLRRLPQWLKEMILSFGGV